MLKLLILLAIYRKFRTFALEKIKFKIKTYGTD